MESKNTVNEPNNKNIGNKSSGNSSSENNFLNIAFSPAAKVFGEKAIPASENIAESLNIATESALHALKPLADIIECAGLSMSWFTRKLKNKIKNMSPENVIEPDKRISGPVISALQDCEEDEYISNIFANLIANSIDRNTCKISHPSFASIIQQITSDEAKILQIFETHVSYPVFDIFAIGENNDIRQYFATNVTDIAESAGCSIPELNQTYIDNLCRLYLLRKGGQCLDQKRYDALMDHKTIKSACEQITTKGKKPYISRTAVTITDFGRKFLNACLIDKEDYNTKIENDKLIVNPYI